MFRRLMSTLPKDPDFPADLEALGYFVNEKDQIRQITEPDEEFHYFISKNERVLDMQREAMNECIRQMVFSRLTPFLEVTRLPLGTSPDQPHVPILVSTNLATAKRVIIFFGEMSQDLGIFAYRIVGRETIAAGSAIDFVDAIRSSEDPSTEIPGTIIANMGQLIWHRRGARAMTQASWHALPRKSAVDAPPYLDGVKNRVPGNEGLAQHARSVFEEVVENLVNKGAMIDIIGIEDGAVESVEYVQSNWEKWKGRVQAIAIGTSFPLMTELWNKQFLQFWGKRGRAYRLSDEPLNTPVTGREEFGCNCYSSGEPVYIESVMSRAYKSFLDYFKLVTAVPGYEEVEMIVSEPTDESADRINSEQGELS